MSTHCGLHMQQQTVKTMGNGTRKTETCTHCGQQYIETRSSHGHLIRWKTDRIAPGWQQKATASDEHA